MCVSRHYYSMAVWLCQHELRGFLFQMTTQMHIFGFLLVPFIESRCRDYDAPVLEAFPEKIFFGSRLASCIEETKRGIAEIPEKW